VKRPTRTELLGGTAIGITVAAIAQEYWTVWRRGRAPLPAETDHVLEAGAEAARETVEVAVTGYRLASPRENALLNLLTSYALAAGIVRLSTHAIRVRGSWGPFRNRRLGGRHIHHFIPGIVLAFVAGGVSVVSRDEELDKWLAIPFGVGTALTLDEAALLVELEDVYWSEEGILSVQVTTATMALLGSLALGLRVLHRGEEEVLPPEGSDGGGLEERAGPT
jgi:hypothetical protein